MAQWEAEAMYAAFSRMVYWAAYGVTKSESDALDITQETFIRAIKHADKLKSMEEAQLKGWLYRVCINLCMDSKRKQKREQPSEELPEVTVESEYELPEASAINKESRQSVRKAVDELPEIYRETVILHYFSNLRYDEIAALQGVSEGTVKSRISRAKARLAKALERR